MRLVNCWVAMIDPHANGGTEMADTKQQSAPEPERDEDGRFVKADEGGKSSTSNGKGASKSTGSTGAGEKSSGGQKSKSR